LYGLAEKVIGGKVDGGSGRKGVKYGHEEVTNAGDGILREGGVGADGCQDGCDVVVVTVLGEFGAEEAVRVVL
jgi:hypothetical protein